MGIAYMTDFGHMVSIHSDEDDAWVSKNMDKINELSMKIYENSILIKGIPAQDMKKLVEEPDHWDKQMIFWKMGV